MATCFCGCDEPAKGFASRGHNKQGRHTAEQLRKLTSLKERSLALAEELGDLEEFLPGTVIAEHEGGIVAALNEFASSVDEIVSMGEDHADTSHSVLHDGHRPIEGVLNYRRSWLTWGKGAMSATPLLKSSDEKLIVFALAATNYEGEI